VEIAGRIESASAHPLARAFPSFAGNQAQVQVVAGKGLKAELEGHHWRLGQIDFAAFGARARSEPGEDTEIWLSDENGWLARFELSDSLRMGAAQAVDILAGQGLDISILSGDSEHAVKRVAKLIGITRWRARQSPEQKLHAIAELKQQGQTVLMIGDGVNDAPVLAAADVSMTVKGGSELANSAADMILSGESLLLAVQAREIAQKAQRLIRQNLAWALVYNASVLPLAISGLLQPWMAALGMSLSSLLVVANATRLVKSGNPLEEASPA
jgi:Cu2+-exporting ATPase